MKIQLLSFAESPEKNAFKEFYLRHHIEDVFWSLASICGFLDQDDSYLFTISQASKIAGFSIVKKYPDFIELIYIFSSPSNRQKGGALLLLEHSKAYFKNSKAKKFYLEVNSTNFAAIKLYKKLGFKAGSTRKNYYPNGEDALLMSLPI